MEKSKPLHIHGIVRDTVTTTCPLWPSGISVTRGRELIYSDDNSDTVDIVRDGKSLIVVLVGMEGRVRFRYDGKPAKRGMSFDSRGIVTDDLSQIIVADFNIDCLHIRDKNGHLLRCVNDCGLEEPNGLSLEVRGNYGWD
uniref:Uncharacterized protein LOC111117229 n=1 Tax=Crassostrea virginica TaxID=6565 RepID=A0A8B8C8D8_CRAVI|nr:uncharacterized protein LOC111117229 [Crassostrea virginica]